MILTEKLDEVREGLEEVERLVNENGWTATGFVSYEAAPAFDPSLRVRSAHGFPLLWFGLYEAPQIIKRSDVFHESEALPALSWQPDVEKETYNESIRIIKDRIAHGKTYQVNYTMRLNADFEIGAASLTIIVPDGVAVRARAAIGAGDFSMDRSRFPSNESPDFASAANAVDIHIRGGAASVRIK